MSTAAPQTPLGLRIALCRPKESTPVDRNQTAVALPSSASTTSGNTAAAPGADSGMGAPHGPPAGLLEARTWFSSLSEAGHTATALPAESTAIEPEKAWTKAGPTGPCGSQVGAAAAGTQRADGEDSGGEQSGTTVGARHRTTFSFVFFFGLVPVVFVAVPTIT